MITQTTYGCIQAQYGREENPGVNCCKVLHTNLKETRQVKAESHDHPLIGAPAVASCHENDWS